MRNPINAAKSLLARPKFALVAEQPAGAAGDGTISLREKSVTIWNPPVTIGADGRLVGGMTMELAGAYLIATTAAMVNSQFGDVAIEFDKAVGIVGRFAKVNMDLRAWGAQVSFVVPVQPVDYALAEILVGYRKAVAEKMKQLYRGKASYTHSNEMLQAVYEQLVRMRDFDRPMFTQPEYALLVTSVLNAKTMSALLPTHGKPGDKVFGASVAVRN